MKQEELCQQIAQIMQRVLLYEVAVLQKPGLVSPDGNGAHKDMNFYTFLDSAVVLKPYFFHFAEEGCRWQQLDGGCLATIRPLGIDCEKAMFKATGGVNTHKGAIFILSILSACAGYLYSRGGITAERLCTAAAVVSTPALGDFCCKDLEALPTKGQLLYEKEGIRGVRGEMAMGLPSVISYALPVVRARMGSGSINEVLLDALVALIAQVEDTNILARRGQKILHQAQQRAAACIAAGGSGSPEGREQLAELNRWFEVENISPGGCADLLSAALALYWMEQL